MKKLFMGIVPFIFANLALAQESGPRASVELANRALLEVRTVGEIPQICQLSIDNTQQVPRFVTGLAPCGALSGAGWQATIHSLGQSYTPEEVRSRNIELSAEHNINPNQHRSMGELRLDPSHIIQMQEEGGAKVFIPFERVECEAIASEESENSRLFRHPETGEVTRTEEGIIRYYLPGREEPIEKRWNFTTFNEKCSQLLTEQMNRGPNENYGVGLCLAYHQASPSNFPIQGERPQYYCLSNTAAMGEKACVGEGQEELENSEPEAKDDEASMVNIEEELEGNGGNVCCGAWSEGRSCSLCTTNAAFGFRDIFDSNSRGSKNPTFHVVECIGPRDGNSYKWGSTLSIQLCSPNDPCCDISRYDDPALVNECLRRLNWKNGDCAASANEE